MRVLNHWRDWRALFFNLSLNASVLTDITIRLFFLPVPPLWFDEHELPTFKFQKHRRRWMAREKIWDEKYLNKQRLFSFISFD